MLYNCEPLGSRWHSSNSGHFGCISNVLKLHQIVFYSGPDGYPEFLRSKRSPQAQEVADSQCNH